MTKKQLLKELEKVDDNVHILLASDEEGNNFRKLSDVSFGNGLRYIKDAYYSDLVIVDPEDIGEDYLTQKEYDKAKECVVLYP